MAALDFPATPSTGQIFTGPNGAVWSWDGTKWISATSGNLYSAINNVGRNYVHNSQFAIWQRGAGPWTTTATYTADRWVATLNLDTVSIIQQPLNDGHRVSIGDEAAIFALRNTFTGNAGAAAINYVSQKIEGARRLGGKTVTVSFWALASATLSLGVNLYQDVGTGGSPAGAGWLTGQSASVGTAFARYSLTFTVPNLQGKTLGTNNNDSTWLTFFYSSGATSNALTGNIGVQSGQIWLWGVQLEVGTVATPLEQLDPVTQLQQCQRFYQTGYAAVEGYNTAGAGIGYRQAFVVSMRAAPGAVPLTSPGYVNASGATTVSVTFDSFEFKATVTATGAAVASATWTASADL